MKHRSFCSDSGISPHALHFIYCFVTIFWYYNGGLVFSVTNTLLNVVTIFCTSLQCTSAVTYSIFTTSFCYWVSAQSQFHIFVRQIAKLTQQRCADFCCSCSNVIYVKRNELVGQQRQKPLWFIRIKAPPVACSNRCSLVQMGQFLEPVILLAFYQ